MDPDGRRRGRVTSVVLPCMIRGRWNVVFSTENNLQRGVTAYHPKTAIPRLLHTRVTARMGRRTRRRRWPRRSLSTSGQLFLNPGGNLLSGCQYRSTSITFPALLKQRLSIFSLYAPRRQYTPEIFYLSIDRSIDRRHFRIRWSPGKSCERETNR